MAIEIKLSTNSDAFGECNSDQFGEEVARILETAAINFRNGWATFPLVDSNGNTVGRAGLVTEEQ